MDKRVANAEAAVLRVKDGATILMGGFGASGVPENLIRALCRQGTRDLTVVSNNAGIQGYGIDLLLKNRQVKKMIASFVGGNKTFEQLALKKEIDLELNPQGTLAETNSLRRRWDSCVFHAYRLRHLGGRRQGSPRIQRAAAHSGSLAAR